MWIDNAKLEEWAKSLDAIPHNTWVYDGPGGCREMEWEITEEVKPAWDVAKQIRVLVERKEDEMQFTVKGQPQQPASAETVQQLFKRALKGLDCASEILRQMNCNAESTQAKLAIVKLDRQADLIRRNIRRQYRRWQDEQGWVTEQKEDDNGA